jgi:ATP-dependent Lon protease
MADDAAPVSFEEQAKPVAEVPTVLPLLKIVNQVIFPLSVVPTRLASASETKLVDDVVMGNKLLAILTVKNPDADDGGLDSLYEVGVIGRVLQIQHLPENAMNAVIQAIRRFRVLGVEQREPYMTVRIQPLEEPPVATGKLAPLVTAVKMQMAKLIRLSPNIPDAAQSIIESIDDPGFLADLIASNVNIAIDEKQKILDILDREKRLERLTYVLAREIDLLELSDKIQRDVKSTINQGQREFFLRQQLTSNCRGAR